MKAFQLLPALVSLVFLGACATLRSPIEQDPDAISIPEGFSRPHKILITQPADVPLPVGPMAGEALEIARGAFREELQRAGFRVVEDRTFVVVHEASLSIAELEQLEDLEVDALLFFSPLAEFEAMEVGQDQRYEGTFSAEAKLSEVGADPAHGSARFETRLSAASQADALGEIDRAATDFARRLAQRLSELPAQQP